MPNVNPEVCLLCRFKKECQYLHGAYGMNLTFLIANKDGSCQKFGAEEKVIKEDVEAENS